MSKKYIPSFLKEQQPTPNTTKHTSDSGPGWLNQRQSVPLVASNKFAAFSDDFNMKKDKTIVNTSLPAKDAPKLAPATLASLTGGTSAANSSSTGPKRSFASKFAEQVKIASNPNYKPPAKIVDVTSENEFPSLGGPKKPATGAWTAKPKNDVHSEKTTLSFADKAKEWAKQKQEEEEAIQRKIIEDEKKKNDAAFSQRMTIVGLNRYKRKYATDEDDDEYNNEESSFGDDDSYEVPEGDEEPSEEEDDEDEFNQNVGWDGRRKGDLY